MSHDELSELIVRTALKDRAAFHDLYQRTSAKLFGVCLRVLKDRADAEEALQEIYAKLWDKADRYAATDLSPITWLVAVARNHAIDRLRARKPANSDIDDAHWVADERPGPEAEAIATGERARLNACLEELDPAHSDAVRGAYLEGYSYNDLATRHDVPLNTMKTWLRRSLMKLKDCLER